MILRWGSDVTNAWSPCPSDHGEGPERLASGLGVKRVAAVPRCERGATVPVSAARRYPSLRGLLGEGLEQFLGACGVTVDCYQPVGWWARDLELAAGDRRKCVGGQGYRCGGVRRRSVGGLEVTVVRSDVKGLVVDAQLVGGVGVGRRRCSGHGETQYQPAAEDLVVFVELTSRFMPQSAGAASTGASPRAWSVSS